MARHLRPRRGPAKRVLIQAHEQRLADARALFRAGRWTGAVYLSGYVLECLLKAAILSRRGLRALPEEYWRHDLRELAAAAGLDRVLERPEHRRLEADLALISGLWSVNMRYEGALRNREIGRVVVRAVEELRQWLLPRI